MAAKSEQCGDENSFTYLILFAQEHVDFRVPVSCSSYFYFTAIVTPHLDIVEEIGFTIKLLDFFKIGT